jgi:ERF superfamily
MAARGQRKSGNDNDERVVKQGPPPDPTTSIAAAMEIFSEDHEGNPDWKSLNLYGKLAAISGYIPRIPKNGHNNFNNYNYVLESDLVEAVRFLLSAARILIFPESFRLHEVHTFEGQLRDGKQRDILTDSIIVYRAVDGYNGDSFTFEVNAQGSDPRDKGANKASTSAMKFAYMRLLNISSGEDAEGDEKGDEREALGSTEPPRVVVSGSNNGGGNVERGGHQEFASGAQIRAISNKSNQLELGAVGLAALIKKVLGTEVQLPQEEGPAQGKALADFLKLQKSEDAGKIVYALDEAINAAGPATATDEPL